MYRLDQSGEEITVKFAPDGHVSRFSLEWLSGQRARTRGDGRTEDDKQLWRAADLEASRPVTSWASYLDDNRERLRILRAVAGWDSPSSRTRQAKSALCSRS